MKEQKLTPKIRFSGFTEDWEQRKFGDIFTVSQGLQIPISKRYTEPGKNRYFYITNEFLKDTCEESFYIESPSESVTCNEDDILMTRTGNTGIVVTDVSGCFHNNFFKIKYDKDNYSKRFICYLLSSNLMQKTLLKYAGSSTIPDLSHRNFYRISSYFPVAQTEQQKIGDFLSKLDNLITIHQRKVDNYQLMKKSFLQKMFPKKSEKFPEIRFSGFTDAWEQRKLEESFDFLQNNTLSRAELGESGTALNVHYGDILVKFGDCIDVSKNELPYITNQNSVEKLINSYLRDGDVVMADTAEDETVGKCSELTDIKDKIVVSGLHTIPLRPKNKFGKGYLGYYLNSGSYHDQLKPLMQGIKVTSISKSALKNTIVSFPKDVSEQEKIGSFFIRIDNLITLHQRKVDNYKLMKKGFLQQMFI